MAGPGLIKILLSSDVGTVSVGEVCAAFASYSNKAAFPPGQIADLDTAIIAVCDDLYPEHCAHFFSQFSVQCCSCQAIGKISVPLFDSLLVVHAQGGSIDLNTMLNSRNPRLALDRDDVGFSHVPHCSNHDQLDLDEVKRGLLFTLKITSPLGQLPSVTQVLRLLHQHYRVSSFDQDPAVQTFVLTGIRVYSRSDKHLISKMEKPKVANPKLELFGDSLLQFFVCACFQTVCLDLSEQFISHFISFLILHLKRWALGFLQIWSNGPRLAWGSEQWLSPLKQLACQM
jgi:hypothetical protein